MIKRPLAFICLLILIVQGLLLNISSGQFLKEMPASSIFQESDGKIVHIKGQVYNKKLSKNTQVLFLKNNSYSDEKLIIYDSHFTNISIGQTLECKGEISHFDEARNPGNFDQVSYYAKEKIYGAIFLESVFEIGGEEHILRENLFRLKMSWKNMLISSMGEENGTILAAMLLGEKNEMDTEMKELYQKNGIGHILAISGLHISFIGIGLYKIIRKSGAPFLLSGVIAVVLLSLYTIMIGFSVSVLRAYVMLLLRILADVTGRVYDMITALLLSAAITVVIQPLYLMDAGFYLSYGAILGVLFVIPILNNSRFGKCRWMILCSSGLAINIMLLPIQLWYYYEFPLYSIFLNLIIIPLMSVLLGAGMIGSLLTFLMQPVGIVLLSPCGWILNLFQWISEIGMKLPFARIVVGQPKLWEVIFYYVILGILISGMGKSRIWKVAYLMAVCLLLVKFTKGLSVTMMDVGQGDGIFFRGPKGVTYFIDGGSSDEKELGKYRIEPYLKYEGVGTLDYVFLSHGDVDHCSGIEEMLGRQDVGIRIKHLVLPANYKKNEKLVSLKQQAKENGTKVLFMEEGKRIREGELTITCIQPDTISYLNGNAGSMVLEIDYKDFEMLFTGDVEGEGETELIRKVKGRQYDVLKVSHHGSKYSSEAEFLDAIRGNVALISAGRRNSYGHPHDETLKRLKERDYKIYSTMYCGAIMIKTNGENLSLDVFH